MIVSGLNGLSKANALQHVEEASSNGSDINFKKRNMEDCHVVVIQFSKLNVVKSLVLDLLIVNGLNGLRRMENALNHVEEASKHGPDINFKKKDMEENHVVVIGNVKLIVI